MLCDTAVMCINLQNYIHKYSPPADRQPEIGDGYRFNERYDHSDTSETKE